MTNSLKIAERKTGEQQGPGKNATCCRRRDGRLPDPRAEREVDAPEGEPGWREVRAQEAVANVRGKRQELAFVP